jgi:hypothetical protein
MTYGSEAHMATEDVCVPCIILAHLERMSTLVRKAQDRMVGVQIPTRGSVPCTAVTVMPYTTRALSMLHDPFKLPILKEMLPCSLEDSFDRHRKYSQLLIGVD